MPRSPAPAPTRGPGTGESPASRRSGTSTVFDPTFDERCVADMQTMTDHLASSGRIAEGIGPPSYTSSTDPTAEAGATLHVEGTCQA